MKVTLLPDEIEKFLSDALREKLNMGFHGWTLTTADRIDGSLEFEEKPAPPIVTKGSAK